MVVVSVLTVGIVCLVFENVVLVHITSLAIANSHLWTYQLSKLTCSIVEIICIFSDPLQCEPNDDISKEHQHAVVDIVQAIESIPVFSSIKEVIGDADDALKVSGCSVVNGLSSCRTTRAHYLTMVMLFWPYPELAGCRGARLQKLVNHQLASCAAVGCELLRNEVHQLHQQFQSVLGYVNRCCSCHCSKDTEPVK